MCMRAPVLARQARSAARSRPVSAAAGRLSQPGRDSVAGVAARARDAQQRRQLGVHEQRQAERARIGMRLRRSALADVRELVDARRAEEALEAEHAGRGERLEVAALPGTTPPQKPTST